jgi:hypothetical protein
VSKERRDVDLEVPVVLGDGRAFQLGRLGARYPIQISPAWLRFTDQVRDMRTLFRFVAKWRSIAAKSANAFSRFSRHFRTLTLTLGSRPATMGANWREGRQDAQEAPPQGGLSAESPRD